MPDSQMSPHTTPARPDTRDWTFVLFEPCPECGFTAGGGPETVGARLQDAAGRWQAVLARPGVTIRPEPDVWSPLEYACHVAELSQVFGVRVQQMRDTDNPTFSDWDGEQAALDGDYNARDPLVVAADIDATLQAAAGLFDRLDAADWRQPGTRGDGKHFTIATLADYWLHEVHHHLTDVGG